MKKYKLKKLLFLLILFTPNILFVSEASASGFGAEIFCTMRDGGNDHESSWKAAYSYIKKQKGGLFKIKPNTAQVKLLKLS